VFRGDLAMQKYAIIAVHCVGLVQKGVQDF
jgi:hypothetical protein